MKMLRWKYKRRGQFDISATTRSNIMRHKGGGPPRGFRGPGGKIEV